MRNLLVTGGAGFIETNIVGTYILLEVARLYWQKLNPDWCRRVQDSSYQRERLGISQSDFKSIDLV